MPMNIVKSQEKNDCGICALACATGRPWHEVKAAIWAGRTERKLNKRWPRNPDGSRAQDTMEVNHSCATTGLDLIDAMTRLGFYAPEGRCKGCPIARGTWDDLWLKNSTMGEGAFVVVRVQYQNARASHWVVLAGHHDGGMIYDSNWDCPVQPRSYAGHIPLSYIIFKSIPTPRCDDL